MNPKIWGEPVEGLVLEKSDNKKATDEFRPLITGAENRFNRVLIPPTFKLKLQTPKGVRWIEVEEWEYNKFQVGATYSGRLKPEQSEWMTNAIFVLIFVIIIVVAVITIPPLFIK